MATVRLSGWRPGYVVNRLGRLMYAHARTGMAEEFVSSRIVLEGGIVDVRFRDLTRAKAFAQACQDLFVEAEVLTELAGASAPEAQMTIEARRGAFAEGGAA